MDPIGEIQDRNKQILRKVLGGTSMAEVGREVSLSRERIRQIVEKELKEADFEGVLPEGWVVNWDKLNEMRKELGILHRDVGIKAGCARETASRVLNANEAYLKTNTSFEVLVATLDLILDKLEVASELGEVIKKN